MEENAKQQKNMRTHYLDKSEMLAKNVRFAVLLHVLAQISRFHVITTMFVILHRDRYISI